MATIYVRGVTAEMQAWLEAEAGRRDQSVAAVVRSVIRDAMTRPVRLGSEPPPARFSGIPQIIDGREVQR